MEQYIPGIEETKLREAAKYLLDPVYGEKREQRLREALMLSNGVTPRLQRDAICLREVFNLFRLYPAVGAEFLYSCHTYRTTVLTTRVYVNTKTRRERSTRYMQDLRHRKQLAVLIQEYRTGKTMPRAQAQEYAKACQERWTAERQKYIEAREPGISSKQASTIFTAELTKRLEAELEQAKQQGPIKKPSSFVRVPASTARLNALQQKHDARQKNSSMDG